MATTDVPKKSVKRADKGAERARLESMGVHPISVLSVDGYGVGEVTPAEFVRVAQMFRASLPSQPVRLITENPRGDTDDAGKVCTMRYAPGEDGITLEAWHTRYSAKRFLALPILDAGGRRRVTKLKKHDEYNYRAHGSEKSRFPLGVPRVSRPTYNSESIDVEKVRAMLAEGKSAFETANALGYSYSVMLRVLRNAPRTGQSVISLASLERADAPLSEEPAQEAPAQPVPEAPASEEPAKARTVRTAVYDDSDKGEFRAVPFASIPAQSAPIVTAEMCAERFLSSAEYQSLKEDVSKHGSGGKHIFGVYRRADGGLEGFRLYKKTVMLTDACALPNEGFARMWLALDPNDSDGKCGDGTSLSRIVRAAEAWEEGASADVHCR